MKTEAETQTALIEMPAMNLPSPTEIGDKIHNSFKTIYTKLEQQIKDAEPDVTTNVGREAIASLAYKISRTKTGLNDAAAALTADQKAIIDVVNKERREMRDELDALRDRARAPLNEWEAEEKERKALVEATVFGLANIKTHPAFGKTAIECNSEQLASIINKLASTKYQPSVYLDRLEEVQALHGEAIASIEVLYSNAKVQEAQQAELEELRALKQQREEEDRLRAEEEAAAEAEKKRIEQARIDEENRKAEAERLEREAKERADRQAQEAIDVANQRAKDAEELAERQAQEAEDDKIRIEKEAKERAEFAAKEERNRQARIAETARLQDEERAADLKHRRKINKAALAAILKVSEVSEDQGKMIVQAISKGHVPHISIKY